MKDNGDLSSRGWGDESWPWYDWGQLGTPRGIRRVAGECSGNHTAPVEAQVSLLPDATQIAGGWFSSHSGVLRLTLGTLTLQACVHGS